MCVSLLILYIDPHSVIFFKLMDCPGLTAVPRKEDNHVTEPSATKDSATEEK